MREVGGSPKVPRSSLSARGKCTEQGEGCGCVGALEGWEPKG